MTHNQLLEKASQHALSETLGYDEGKAYYYLLTKQEKKLEIEYSYSKRYRLLKNLYIKGVVGKQKSEDRDLFYYFILPPSFLYFCNTNTSSILWLESLYEKYHSQLFKKEYLQMTAKDLNGFILYLLRHGMKKNASIQMDNTKISNMLGKDITNISFIEPPKYTRRVMGIIDKNIVFDFSRVTSRKEPYYVGFLSYSENSDYFKSVKAALDNNKKAS